MHMVQTKLTNFKQVFSHLCRVKCKEVCEEGPGLHKVQR